MAVTQNAFATMPEGTTITEDAASFVETVRFENIPEDALHIGKRCIIDGLGPNGIAARVMDVTGRVVKLQTGYVYHYAFSMMIGVALLTAYFMFASGGLTQ